MNKAVKRKSLIIVLSLLFLANPNINLIDILPDCISYILLLLVLRGAMGEVPYAAELKDALRKLTLFTAIKIPAFFIMYSNLKYGRDIIPLFTLTFSALELIYLCYAIGNCFRMLGYIGERTDATVTIEPFKISRRGRHTMHPTALKTFTFIFVFAKAIFNLLPELLLLTQEDVTLRMKLSEAYPAVLVSCFLIGIIPCLIWLKMALGYVRALKESQTFINAVASFEKVDLPEEEKRKNREKMILNSLSAIALSSLFTFDVVFEDFSSGNLLPHFIYGIIIYISLIKISDTKSQRIALSSVAIPYIVSSTITHILISRFFETYQHIDLKYSSIAKSEYLYIEIAAVCECVLVVMLLIISAITFADFIKNNTGTSPTSSEYGEFQKRDHTRLIIKGSVLFAIPALINILKCINVFSKAAVKIAFTDNRADGFATSSMPWMGTVIFGLCVIYTIYAFYCISELSSEIKFKYSK